MAGCTPETGELVEVRGPAAASSLAVGVTALDFVVAHQSFCGRWVGDTAVNHTRVDVDGRDLTKKPYEFLLRPAHDSDLSDLVYVAALAYAADGRLLGVASTGAHPLQKDKVLQRATRIGLLSAAAQPDGPRYVAGDGCVCMPGQPWIGNGSQSGCDLEVLTSFARLGDTAGCELPAGAALPAACDGQLYPNEAHDRPLPCWADDAGGGCRVGLRTCADHDGFAYNGECITTNDDLPLDANDLCAAYLQCQRSACGDVAGCFRGSFAPATTTTVQCTLRVDPTTVAGAPIRPCGGVTGWTATLPGSPSSGSDCTAAVLDGVAQPPFTVGLVVSGVSGVLPRSASCPTTLQVDAIDAPYPMALPATHTVDLVVGGTLTRVTLNIVQQCDASTPALVCSTP